EAGDKGLGCAARANDLEAARQRRQAIARLLGEQAQPGDVVADRQDRARLRAQVVEGHDLAVPAGGPERVTWMGEAVAQRERDQVGVEDRVAVEEREGLDQV